MWWLHRRLTKLGCLTVSTTTKLFDSKKRSTVKPWQASVLVNPSLPSSPTPTQWLHTLQGSGMGSHLLPLVSTRVPRAQDRPKQDLRVSTTLMVVVEVGYNCCIIRKYQQCGLFSIHRYQVESGSHCDIVTLENFMSSARVHGWYATRVRTRAR